MPTLCHIRIGEEEEMKLTKDDFSNWTDSLGGLKINCKNYEYEDLVNQILRNQEIVEHLENCDETHIIQARFTSND